MNKYTLLFFGDQWDDMWRRRQQLAYRLSKKEIFEKVIYIERPLNLYSFLKFLLGKTDLDTKKRWEKIICNRSLFYKYTEKLTIFSPICFLPTIDIPFLFKVEEWSRNICTLLFLKKKWNKLNIVWISHPQISVKFLKKLQYKYLWYDCTEDFSKSPTLTKCVYTQITETDKYLSSKADIITTVSEILYKTKKQKNSYVYNLPNAVDVDIFLEANESKEVPKEIKQIKYPILMFVGFVNEWANRFDIIFDVAQKRTDWNIVFLGRGDISKETSHKLAKLKNIFFVGQKSYRELAKYIKNSDLCFQFYKEERVNDTRNSQKLFLYLAAGKPIVSTLSADVEKYKDFVTIFDNTHTFINAINFELKNDSPDKILKRQSFAKANSWDFRIEKILEIVKERFE